MASVTIHDVARAAGVSISVVSRALNGRSGINEDTRRRVRAAADSVGYEVPLGLTGDNAR